MKKIFLLLTFFSFLFLGVFLFLNKFKTTIPSQNTGKKHVIASFYPLFFFAREIGGELIDVVNITPAGAEPHDFEPTTQDLARVETSDLLFLNGIHFEGWGDKVKENLKGKKTLVVEVSEHLATRETQEGKKIVKDPHVWLSPKQAKEMENVILQALIHIDPQNKSFYEKNAQRLEQQFDALDALYQKKLENCSDRTIVTSHAAFGYLAERYNLKQIPISGLSPEEEPSSKQLAEVATFVKKNNVKYIFFETLVSPRLAETIAQEAGAHSLVLNPLEGLTEEEQEKGKNYFTIQKENLENLKRGLDCI